MSIYIYIPNILRYINLFIETLSSMEDNFYSIIFCRSLSWQAARVITFDNWAIYKCTNARGTNSETQSYDDEEDDDDEKRNEKNKRNEEGGDNEEH